MFYGSCKISEPEIGFKSSGDDREVAVFMSENLTAPFSFLLSKFALPAPNPARFMMSEQTPYLAFSEHIIS